MSTAILGRVRTRRFWEPLARALFFMASGAVLFALYLATRDVALPDRVQDRLGPIWFGSYILWTATLPRRSAAGKDPTPAWSGTATVLVCGIAAAIFFGNAASSFFLAGTILLATIAAAILVYRFATTHARDIGEARFATPGSGQDAG